MIRKRKIHNLENIKPQKTNVQHGGDVVTTEECGVGGPYLY